MLVSEKKLFPVRIEMGLWRQVLLPDLTHISSHGCCMEDPASWLVSQRRVTSRFRVSDLILVTPMVLLFGRVFTFLQNQEDFFFFFLTKLLSLLTCWPKYVIMLLFQLLESKERAKAVVSVFQQTSSLNWREEFIGNTPQKCPEAENEAWKRQDGVKRPDPEVSLGDCNSNLTIRPEWTENCIGTTQKQPFWMMCLLSKAPIPRTEHLHDATSIRAYTSLGCRKSWSPVLPDSIQGKTGVSLGRGNGCWEAKILPSVHDIWYYWHICIQKYLRMVAGFAV